MFGVKLNDRPVYSSCDLIERKNEAIFCLISPIPISWGDLPKHENPTLGGSA